MTSHLTLTYRSLGIDTLQEHVAYLHRDCPICKSEGLEAQTRVRLIHEDKVITAVINVIHSELIESGEIGLSISAEKDLGVGEGDRLEIAQAPTVNSLSQLRSKMFGHRLDKQGIQSIVADIAKGRYTNIQIAAFLTAMASHRANLQEVIDLTSAMVDVGERVQWGVVPVADKHCVGGLPGNRTTPIVVAIVACAGLTIPKTSSRAITSPAGTADVVEVMTPVTHSLEQMHAIVKKEGACLVWGGALALSPADDLLIKVARPLDIDSDAQMVASVLSKKIAAGATHAVIDIPVGPTAKVRNKEQADHLEHLMTRVAFANGLTLKVLRTDGTAPVGRGIGPALEARDVLQVLRSDPNAPEDLRQRAVRLASELLQLCGVVAPGAGVAFANEALNSGRAWSKFLAICEAQGGFTEPAVARLQQTVLSTQNGIVKSIDNRRVARIAKLAGAPEAKTAGIDLSVRLGDQVKAGDPLFVIHAQAPGELTYALAFLDLHPPILIVPI